MENMGEFEEQPAILDKISEEMSVRKSVSNKRRASVASSDTEKDFKGFDNRKQEDLSKDYRRVIDLSADPEMENMGEDEENPAIVDKIAEEMSVRKSVSNKRRASVASSDTEKDFKGFDNRKQADLSKDYRRVIEMENMGEDEENPAIVDKIAEEMSVRKSVSNKRRASVASSDTEEDFKGFDHRKQEDLSKDYRRVIEQMEAEILTAEKEIKPVKTLKVPIRASNTSRQDTDGSQPSSALSSRSDGEQPEAGTSGSVDVRGRRSSMDMSSPLLRVPLERGWRRELVYRAVVDSHSRRNGDIYYYTPHGKKLRSSTEVAEHLLGTDLTLENFSFYKEPLGVDDPEKEIIRDAKRMQRVESPVPPPTTEGKCIPKPKTSKRANRPRRTHTT